MKAPLLLLLACAVLVLVGGVAAGSFGDRSLFVPPPDAVAEAFVREVQTERFSRAQSYLADHSSLSEEDLRRLAQTIEEHLGNVGAVEAATRAQTREQATAAVTLHSARGEKTVAFDLRWENGAWRIVSER